MLGFLYAYLEIKSMNISYEIQYNTITDWCGVKVYFSTNIHLYDIQVAPEFQILKWLVKILNCCTLCRSMTFYMNIEMGEGKEEFVYNFNNVGKQKMSPSQEKRNFLRKHEFLKSKVENEEASTEEVVDTQENKK